MVTPPPFHGNFVVFRLMTPPFSDKIFNFHLMTPLLFSPPSHSKWPQKLLLNDYGIKNQAGDDKTKLAVKLKLS